MFGIGAGVVLDVCEGYARFSFFCRFLHALENRFFSLLLCGTAAWVWEYPYVLSFVEMSVERRNIVFTRWMASRITPLTAVCLV